MADPYNVGLGDLANRVTASGGATNAWGYGFGTDNGTVSLEMCIRDRSMM